MFQFLDCKTLYFTVHSTMDELYRMDFILGIQGESFVKQLQDTVSIYCIKYSTKRSEGNYIFMVFLLE